MAFRGDINALILAALQAGPEHGYQIVRRLREAGAVSKLSEGQIYPYLHELEGEGLLAAEWQTDTGAAPRKVYRITPKGEGELHKHRDAWEKFSSGVGSLLAGQPKKIEGNHA